MAELKILVGADISELKDELAKAQILLENLKKQKSNDVKLGLDTVDLQRQINDAKTNISGLTKQINNSSTAFNNHSKATANGGNTLMQFSRIAQDAPFGIIGIGNNLTATAESFGHLSKTAGGAGGALKAVASSIMGTGGILLAVSLVTTGLTVLAQKGLTLSDVFNYLSGNFSQAAQDIKKAYEESSKSALGEVASIKAVIAVAQDENASRRERLAAVNELQTKYPAYFGNLSKEEVMYGNLSEQIKNVSQALINKAVAEKVSEKAGDAQYKLLGLNYKMIQAKKDLEKAEQQYLAAAKDPSAGASVERLALNIDNAKLKIVQTRKEWQKANNEVQTYQRTLDTVTKTGIAGKANESDVKAQIAAEKKAAAARAAAEKAALSSNAKNNRYAIEKELEDKLKAMSSIAFADKIALIDSYSSIELSKRQKLKDDILKQEEAYNKSVLDGQNQLAALTAFAKTEQYNNERDQRQQALEQATADIQAHEDFLANVGKTEDSKKTAQEQASYSARLAQLKTFLAQKLITQQEFDALVFEAAKNTNDVLKQFDADVYSLVTGSISDTFGQLGTVIGEALATGGNVLNAVGSALLQGLGKFISEMGGLLIQYGTMAVIKGKLDSAIAVGGPVAIAAGLGAIAVGVALKAIGGAIAAKAKGGAGAGGGGGAVAAPTNQRGAVSTGADVIAPQSSVSNGGMVSSGGGTVVFEIAGQKLIGVLNNTLGANQRLGGSLALGN